MYKMFSPTSSKPKDKMAWKDLSNPVPKDGFPIIECIKKF